MSAITEKSWHMLACRVMLDIRANQVHQVAQAQWVIWVHQVRRFPVTEVKRVFQVQSVSLIDL